MWQQETTFTGKTNTLLAFSMSSAVDWNRIGDEQVLAVDGIFAQQLMKWYGSQTDEHFHNWIWIYENRFLYFSPACLPFVKQKPFHKKKRLNTVNKYIHIKYTKKIRNVHKIQ
jgi:hypothetical protein